MGEEKEQCTGVAEEERGGKLKMRISGGNHKQSTACSRLLDFYSWIVVPVIQT